MIIIFVIKTSSTKCYTCGLDGCDDCKTDQQRGYPAIIDTSSHKCKTVHINYLIIIMWLVEGIRICNNPWFNYAILFFRYLTISFQEHIFKVVFPLLLYMQSNLPLKHIHITITIFLIWLNWKVKRKKLKTISGL